MTKHALAVITLAIAGLLGGCDTPPEPEQIESHAAAHTVTDYPPPPSVCEAAVAAQDVYCMDHVIGNPRAECKQFRLALLGKDDELGGLSYTSTRDAHVAIVKSGTAGCAPGKTAYRIYVDVKAGDTLLPPADQDISHVTYCACPTP